MSDDPEDDIPLQPPAQPRPPRPGTSMLTRTTATARANATAVEINAQITDSNKRRAIIILPHGHWPLLWPLWPFGGLSAYSSCIYIGTTGLLPNPQVCVYASPLPLSLTSNNNGEGEAECPVGCGECGQVGLASSYTVTMPRQRGLEPEAMRRRPQGPAKGD